MVPRTRQVSCWKPRISLFGKASFARRAGPALAVARPHRPALARGGWVRGRGMQDAGSYGGRARGAGVTSCPLHPVAVCRIACCHGACHGVERGEPGARIACGP